MIYNYPTEEYKGSGSMSQKIWQEYYWKTVYEDCKRYMQTCHRCQFQSKPQKNNELYLISIRELWEWIRINIVGPLLITERENKYIVTCIDYMTKWVKVKPLPNKSAV